jgi:hypothetical protein
MSTTYKIHPAIGVARVGNSEDYYIGPETAGGLPFEMTGGPVSQFRDSSGGVKRQAARFRIHAYDTPTSPGRLVQPGVGGVKDIQWTVHLANKKAAWYEFQQQEGADGNYQGHALRNPRTQGQARNQLIIDPGPQSITCLGTQGTSKQAEFTQGQGPAGYPQTFPPAGLIPENSDITTLGSIFTDAQGYLYTLGGYGRSGVSVKYDITGALLQSWRDGATFPSDILDLLVPITDVGYQTEADFEGALLQCLGAANYQTYGSQIEADAYPQPRIDAYANNTFWWDDISDGPVTATLIMDDDTRVTVDAPAWALVAPPAYAPQILNMITLYDTMYDVFVRTANINPALCFNGRFDPTYQPNFQAEIQPILNRPGAYQWVADINSQGVIAHGTLSNPDMSPTNFFKYVRRPEGANDPSPGLMPKMAGDNPITDKNPRNFLVLTDTQYFLLSQYSKRLYTTTPPASSATPGEQLDRAVLDNCVGGPFCPGIEMTWISRDPQFYSEPFRLKHRPLMGQGLHWDSNPHDGQGLEPGDASKYMALPWQADFNECSNQVTLGTSLWWWPAQRPFWVHYEGPGNTPMQGYWTRPYDIDFRQGEQEIDELMVYNWMNLGFIVQQQGGPNFMEKERLPLTHLGMMSTDTKE